MATMMGPAVWTEVCPRPRSSKIQKPLGEGGGDSSVVGGDGSGCGRGRWSVGGAGRGKEAAVEIMEYVMVREVWSVVSGGDGGGAERV